MLDTGSSWIIPFAAAAAISVLAVAFFWSKGRAFAKGDVFRASRLSRGNRLFPTQVLITPASVVQFTPQWVGKLEHSIHIAHVASVEVDTSLIFSDLLIETTGGTDPIRAHGHRKSDAIRIKQLIEQYQSEYYRK